MMWLVYVLGGAVIASQLLANGVAARREEEKERSREFARDRAQARERRRDRAETCEHLRRFWESQVQVVGNYCLRGMPRGMKVTRVLASVEGETLVLHGGPQEIRVLWWDVTEYSEFRSPQPSP